MSKRVVAGKWIDGLHADTPCVVAARRVLQCRLQAVLHFLPLAAEQADEDVEHVHQLRVATRRAGAALRIFRDFCPRGPHKAVRRMLRDVRRAAAVARQDDVHAAVFQRAGERAEPRERDAFAFLAASVASSRAAAQKSLRTCQRAGVRRDLREQARALLDGLNTPPPEEGADAAEPPYVLGELAGRALPPLVEGVGAARGHDLRKFSDVHQLRIAGKDLRYALEVFAVCFPESFKSELYPRIEHMQALLGDLNDQVEIAARVEARARELRQPGDADRPRHLPLLPSAAALRRIAAGYRAARDARHAEFLAWWEGPDARRLFEELAALAAGPTPPRPRLVATTPADEAAGLDPTTPHPRVAAIDVGTNSIRLVVAETDPRTKFRIIEDIKETTRLGGGLYLTGRLNPQAVEQSLGALARMKSVAEGYKVDRIRAVGTSAVREAVNADEFLAAARERAGVEIEVIDADHEARLAFSSVANAFELGDRRVAVVDIGGGSTELIFSSGGVIDAIHKLPLGAVRLTEMCSSLKEPGRYRFGELRRVLDKVIDDMLGAPPYAPEAIYGTGGTFTNLARISIRRGTAADGIGRFPFAVRGYELRASEVSALLDWLRHMSLDERKRVPGLSAQRAEIIVAGIAIVERLMLRLGVERLRVHDGGIRDGLLAEMIDEFGYPHVPRPRAADRLAAARRYARRMEYPKEHSEHVARLAVQIFDQLAVQIPDAAGVWAGREARELLQAAAILHDVGMLIGWRRHHKHSGEMIRRGELPGFTRHEIEIIANVARYHRRRGPRPGDQDFQRLGGDDQRLVAHLAGILRIADGFDRTHTQAVAAVAVEAEPGLVSFAAQSREEPGPNLTFARRKANVFQAAFHLRPRFLWQPLRARLVRTGS